MKNKKNEFLTFSPTMSNGNLSMSSIMHLAKVSRVSRVYGFFFIVKYDLRKVKLSRMGLTVIMYYLPHCLEQCNHILIEDKSEQLHHLLSIEKTWLLAAAALQKLEYYLH